MITKEEIERSIITKYRKTIWRPFTKAIRDYDLISANDKIAVCISGGKDSMILAKCLEELQKHGKVKFDLVYIVMDPHKDGRNFYPRRRSDFIIKEPSNLTRKIPWFN